MGRPWTFTDEAFQRPGYNPNHPGNFIPNTVFVIMSFSPDMDDSYQAIQDGAAAHGMRACRADEVLGAG